MNINRDNYEEYFLLYADNELSKTERKVVEIFVQENPDLKEEFNMWKLTVNSPDEGVKILDKSFLLKKESHFINENNCEEIFVQYYDNELSEEQRKETENFITQNLKFKTDFELIGKAKLTPESFIVYPDKKHLYRKEKSGKIIPMILWRSIAAAVFIGFGLWMAFSYYNINSASKTVVATKNNNVQKPAIKEVKPPKNNIVLEPDGEGNNIASSTKHPVQKRIKKNETEIEQSVLKDQKIKEQSTVNNDIKTNKEPAAQKTDAPKPDIDYQLAVTEKPIVEPSDIKKNEIHLTDNHITMPVDKIEAAAPDKVYTQTVSYVSGADVSDQNYVFYDVPTENFRKSKVGVFLKKVRRVVERNNPITRLFDGDEDQFASK